MELLLMIVLAYAQLPNFFKFDDTPDKSLVLIDSWNVKDL